MTDITAGSKVDSKQPTTHASTLLTSASPDDPEGCVALGFSKKAQACIALGPQGKPTDRTTRMLYASNVTKAREVLSSRGVGVGEIQQDRQGTHYFEMRDLEGNVIEVSEEP